MSMNLVKSVGRLLFYGIIINKYRVLSSPLELGQVGYALGPKLNKIQTLLNMSHMTMGNTPFKKHKHEPNLALSALHLNITKWS